MTEEEAKTKWCPFARVAKRGILPGRSYNRWADDWSPAGAVDGAKCIGSACMAWREGGAYTDKWVGKNLAGDAVIHGKLHITGYCGLAGKP